MIEQIFSAFGSVLLGFAGGVAARRKSAARLAKLAQVLKLKDQLATQSEDPRENASRLISVNPGRDSKPHLKPAGGISLTPSWTTTEQGIIASELFTVDAETVDLVVPRGAGEEREARAPKHCAVRNGRMRAHRTACGELPQDRSGHWIKRVHLIAGRG
jgi:hypothetical protein